MTLTINTAEINKIIISITGKIKTETGFLAKRKQTELLLPKIDSFLSKNSIKKDSIKAIKVINSGGTFTSLRIGVITANALSYALGIPVKGIDNKNSEYKAKKVHIIKPIYNNEPFVS